MCFSGSSGEVENKLYNEELSDLYIILNISVLGGRGNRGVSKLYIEELSDLYIKRNIYV
jgi:hypothetical protein